LILATILTVIAVDFGYITIVVRFDLSAQRIAVRCGKVPSSGQQYIFFINAILHITAS